VTTSRAVARSPLRGPLGKPLRQPKLLHPGATVALGLVALSFQIFLPAYISSARLLDLPLLVVVYLASLRRHVLIGMLLGLAMGVAQDALTHGPIGLFGITKTIVGYSVASLSLYVEMDYPGARSVLTAFFFLVHQGLFFLLAGGLLGQTLNIDPARALMLCAVHAGLALILFPALDSARRATP
jgi:rod shape-determining protein MreD